ncbi:ferredoxin reductase family protein [Levilinea saccharolytica]|uniref:Oxidoreductase n=1 Tax=Levilinea saccharolytica TaxID=229921 RepID=A0A0P6XZE1_9CHLR|nr:ferric reductase-like transmembrane domain-containing protein [Levilinea saccharolytica]KPL81838.1 oxidoreductase [Levilinea saccharolytica]
MRTRRILQGVFWVVVYLALTLAPLLILLVGQRPPGRAFYRDFSVALGFAGLAMMALQFALTARFRFLKAPYGSDIVYFFHRQISLVAFVLILAHPLLLFVFDPQTLGLLNVFSAPWRARAAVTATAALIALVLISIFRKQWKIEYTQWRIWHGFLAAAAVGLGLVHAVLVGYYINTPAKQVLWVGYGLFWVGLLVWVRVIKPLLLLRRPYVIEAVRPERGSAWTLVMRPDGHRGFRFQPGQFAWITAGSSPFADAEHPFSISSSAEDPQRLSMTIKALGDFTSTVKDMKPGQRVYLDGAFGSFSVDRHPHARGFVFIAGGIGITPMMSMLSTLADRGDRRPLWLLYANRDWESVTFREELEALKQRLDLRVIHFLEDPPADWQGETGYINAEKLTRHLPPERAQNMYEMFICGPKPMMDAVEKALVQIKVPMGDFHSERFDMV